MLKRLEIQCVFKELVKDIVVKGQPPTPAAVRYYAGGLLFCRGGIHPFRVHCASRRKIKSENLRRALRCHAVGAAHVRPGTVK